jgi:hypothetical protein
LPGLAYEVAPKHAPLTCTKIKSKYSLEIPGYKKKNNEMGIKGLEKHVKANDRRDPKDLDENVTGGKRLLIDEGVLVKVSSSRYWDTEYDDAAKNNKKFRNEECIFFNPLKAQERLRNFLVAVRAASLVPVLYLGGTCCDQRLLLKRPTQLSRAQEKVDRVNILNMNNGEWAKDTKKDYPSGTSLLHQVAMELIYAENVEVVQCAEEADPQIIRDATTNCDSVFAICGQDSDFFLVAQPVLYIPLYELERAGGTKLKFRAYHRKLVENIINVRSGGLIDLAVYQGCDYTQHLKEDIEKVLSLPPPLLPPGSRPGIFLHGSRCGILLHGSRPGILLHGSRPEIFLHESRPGIFDVPH